MSLKQHFILHSIVYTMLIFIAFFILESGDTNTILMGTFVYMPYALMLSGLNLILIGFGIFKQTKRPLIFLAAFFMNIVLIIWFLANNRKVTIRYWELTLTEFVILNTVIIALNLFTVARLTSRKKREAKL